MSSLTVTTFFLFPDPFYRIAVMAPVHLLDIYNSYSCDKTYHSANVFKQCDLKASYSDDYFNAIRKLIGTKVAKVYS